MQLLNTPRDALLTPLQIVSGLVERRHILPILANVLIRKDGENIALIASDNEMQITTKASIGAGETGMDTTVSARKLLDILRSLPETQNVSLTLKDQRMTVQSGKSRFALQTLPGNDFPTMATAPSVDARVCMPQKTLKFLLDRVYFSMAQQNIRYYLNGVLLALDNQQVITVATDGHRLAYGQATTEETFPRNNIIIPRKTVLELQRLLSDNDEPVQIDVSTHQIQCHFGDITLLSKLVEGQFPDPERLIPKEHPHAFTLNRESLLRALQRVALMTADKFKGVRWMVQPGVLQLTSTNAEHEEACEDIDIDYTGPSFDVGFNVTYLLDILTHLKTDTLTIAMGDAATSALFTVPDNADFKYVVMPMRI